MSILRWALCAALLLVAPAAAHETDNFTIPPGREFADLGPYLSRWVYGLIDKGVAQVNREIQAAMDAGASQAELEELQSPWRIAPAVNAQLPWALMVIENLERQLPSGQFRARFPGQVTSYRATTESIFTFANFPLDPRQIIRLLQASTIRVYGVYIGTDKIGHFTDMGMNYYRRYAAARRQGADEDQAMRRARDIDRTNFFLSERGLLGYATAGSYSNADLAANWVGCLFYRNLTEQVMLKGQPRPPMVVRDGPLWKLADHVRDDPDFFAMFISEHFDEALNPSLYDFTVRGGMRRNLRQRAWMILESRTDPWGNRRPAEYFRAKFDELSTYWGQEYGRDGRPENVASVFGSCFDPPPDGSDVKARDSMGLTALHHAAASGDAALAASLLERGADANAAVISDEPLSSEWGNTPLHLAARRGRVEVIRVLLDRGADVNARGAFGATPLHQAAAQPDAARALLEAGALVDAADNRGRTPAHWAALDESAGTLKLLLAAGAGANARDRDGATPLHIAAGADNGEAVAALLAHGAAADATDFLGATPLHAAAAQRSGRSVRRLIAGGAPIAARDALGLTPLHVAARAGAASLVAILLEAGADAKAADAYGSTPLHLAVRQQSAPTVRLLLEAGADANAQNHVGATPLHEAAAVGDRALAQMLLSSGAAAAVRNRQGETPGELASARGHRRLAAMLNGTAKGTAY